MYEEVGVERLSPAQISKMLKGQSIRVKKGGHHKLQLSKEQSKKLHRASMKGSGITLCLDPYQMDMHKKHKPQEMHSAVMGEGLPRHRGRPRKAYSKGSGIGEFFNDIGHKIESGVRPVIQKATDVGRPVVQKVGKVVKPVALDVFNEINDNRKPIASHLLHTGLPIFTGAAGGVLGGIATENPFGAALGGAAGQYAGQAAADYIGNKTGYGLKKRKSKRGGALLPAGY
jgi:hypothetical protein